MKKLYIILSILSASLLLISCGNRTVKQIDFQPPENPNSVAINSSYEKYDDVEAGPKVYSNSFDGFANIRQSASSKSKVIGKLRNGPDYLHQVGEEDSWVSVYYNGTIGYIYKDIISYEPSAPVYVDVSASWLQGVWGHDSGYYYYFLYNNGKYAFIQQYGRVCYGTYRLEGYEAIFTPEYIFYSEQGDLASESRLEVQKSSRRIGGMSKQKLPLYFYSGEFGGYIDNDYFIEIKKDVNRKVK